MGQVVALVLVGTYATGANSTSLCSTYATNVFSSHVLSSQMISTQRELHQKKLYPHQRLCAHKILVSWHITHPFLHSSYPPLTTEVV